MKRIGILSDTHSCDDPKYAIHFAGCDEIWHAGDVGDMSVVESLETVAPVLRCVSGNVDHGLVRRRFKELEIFELEEVKVLLTHIGGYPGRYAPGMKEMLRCEKIRLMVDGHSHILKVVFDPELNMLHINPGAAGYHGWQRERTLVRLTLDAGDIRDLEVIELARGNK